jgi:hypothetical protein
VARNGALINGAADDLIIDLNNTVVTLIYTGGTFGWVYAAV